METYRVGDRVSHDMWGPGRVIDLAEDRSLLLTFGGARTLPVTVPYRKLQKTLTQGELGAPRRRVRSRLLRLAGAVAGQRSAPGPRCPARTRWHPADAGSQS